MRVAGIDGAPGGWMIVEADVEPEGTIDARFAPSLDSLVASLGDEVTVAVVDMPIGLPADGRRAADDAARSFLGPRRSTFFPTPVRAVLDHDDFDSANAASRAVSGKGLSVQAWNLVPKIREIDTLLSGDPERVERLVEGHPECSFAAMAGAPLASKKREAEGREERVALLRRYVDERADAVVEKQRARIDCIDALALVWTARRIVSGEALVLGEPDASDAAGRPMRLSI